MDRIVAAVAGERSRRWWEYCVRQLGVDPINRALGLLREARQAADVRNPGDLLTKILKDIAADVGVKL